MSGWKTVPDLESEYNILGIARKQEQKAADRAQTEPERKHYVARVAALTSQMEQVWGEIEQAKRERRW